MRAAVVITLLLIAAPAAAVWPFDRGPSAPLQVLKVVPGGVCARGADDQIHRLSVTPEMAGRCEVGRRHKARVADSTIYWLGRRTKLDPRPVPQLDEACAIVGAELGPDEALAVLEAHGLALDDQPAIFGRGWRQILRALQRGLACLAEPDEEPATLTSGLDRSRVAGCSLLLVLAEDIRSSAGGAGHHGNSLNAAITAFDCEVTR